MNLKLLLHTTMLAATLLIFSCGENGNQKPMQVQPKFEKTSLVDTNKVFIEFWQTFRKAIISNDTNAIFSSVKFPFETRGPQDRDPIIKYEQKDFLRVLSAFLKRSNGEPDDIRNTEIPDTSGIFGTEARVGNLEFNYSSGKWKLTFAYLNYDTIEELKGGAAINN
jgi:hypothetical protein